METNAAIDPKILGALMLIGALLSLFARTQFVQTRPALTSFLRVVTAILPLSVGRTIPQPPPPVVKEIQDTKDIAS